MTREQILRELKPLQWEKIDCRNRGQKAETVLWYDFELKEQENGTFTLFKVDIAGVYTAVWDSISSLDRGKAIAWNIYVKQALQTFEQ